MTKETLTGEEAVNVWWMMWADSPDKETAKQKLIDLVEMIAQETYKMGQQKTLNETEKFVNGLLERLKK
jgi:hypothetical protein